jgi:hypothetical protein
VARRITVADARDFAILPLRLSVVRLDPGARSPQPPAQAAFWSLTRTEEELSVVCDEAAGKALCGPGSPEGRRLQGGFRALKLRGPLDFSLTGVLARFLAPLAAADIPVFAVSTFDTDYVLVRDEHLQRAVAALGSAGYRHTDAAGGPRLP